MSDGWFRWFVNVTCILWTLLVCVTFSMLEELPVTAQMMNYASVSFNYHARLNHAQ